MAKKAAKKSATPTYKEDDEVIFQGYSDAVEDDDEVFAAGEVLTITSVVEDEENTYIAVNESGVEGSVYGEELEAAPDEDTETASGDEGGDDGEDEKPPVRKRSTGKTATTKKTAPKKAATKAPAKGKGKPKADEGEAEEKKAAPPKGRAAAKKQKEEEQETEPAEEVDLDEETDIVQNTVAQFEGDPLAAAKALAKQAENLFYTMGGVLSHIKRGALHEQITDSKGKQLYSGRSGFVEYVEAELPDVDYRTVSYWIGIYDKVTEYGIDESELVGLGWSKIRTVLPVMTDAKTARAALKEVGKKGMTRTKLEEYVQKRKQVISGGGKTTKTTKGEAAETIDKYEFKMTLHGEQGGSVKEILEGVVEDREEVATTSAALHAIVIEWSAMQEDSNVDLNAILGHLEEQYGVDIEFSYRDGGEGSDEEGED